MNHSCTQSSRLGRRTSLMQRGFTLVEMVIVLAIIGLILGAVMIGKDVQRNAEYTKIKQKFVDQWVVAYNTHYQRAGVTINDNQTTPRLMVNGTNYVAAAGAPVSGGNMTGVTAPAQVCTGAAPAGAAVQAGVTLREVMQRLGIRMPPGRAEGSEDRYVYLDTNGNPQEVQVCFQWNPPGTASGSGNVMVFYGLTPDLARYLDQAIDGKPDAQEGLFRQAGVAQGTANAPGVEWAANNTYNVAQSGAATATSSGASADEDQVVTVIAHYKMNQ
ncbi:prepilin-type N-terminal cleavage/methylation domain-containing protein [Uliginosibacterium sp. 31-16]|uniref:type II secretion system protein n=1 Tax=Uliginosibacterium sp. 31-16 TaxID=3068315 RepID=UPI00274029D1|nr:prepilin-type N-terminal cleavage/methylation domain-containing protein [Uliginosibacterium sp. 31-16]MDP5238578.1 prepilin-type N-terminal cleavage/methylation domain-containing protein [Uliginosibacterium sp. 31-16]